MSDEDLKKAIDGMDYESMLRIFRFASVDSPYLNGEVGIYFRQQMNIKHDAIPFKDRQVIIERVGWVNGK